MLRNEKGARRSVQIDPTTAVPTFSVWKVPGNEASQARFHAARSSCRHRHHGDRSSRAYRGLSQSAKNASRLTDYDRAAMLARTRMNDLLLDANLPFDGSVEGKFDPDQSGGMPSGWRAILKPFDVPPKAGPGTDILQRVALEVWWMPVEGTRRSIQLEGYRQAHDSAAGRTMKIAPNPALP